mgnify:CR=1 FL=1
MQPLPALDHVQCQQPLGELLVALRHRIDDRLMVAQLLKRQIRGVEIVEVWNREGLESVLLDGRFDILVTDYDLRWSNGLNVLHAVRQQWPARPVIMFTSTGTEEVAVEAMRSGLDDYIIKTPERLVRLSGSVGKALGGGVPVGAALISEEVATRISFGDHGSTYGGNLLACRAALCFLDELRDGLLSHVAEIGRYFERRLTAMAARRKIIKAIRGQGLIWGIELTRDAAAVVSRLPKNKRFRCPLLG